MAAPSIDEIRITNRIKWIEVWEMIEPGYQGVRRSRRKLAIDKHATMAASKKPGSMHWLTEAALLEAMCRVTEGLQTHIENYVPTTQREQRDETTTS